MSEKQSHPSTVSDDPAILQRMEEKLGLRNLLKTYQDLVAIIEEQLSTKAVSVLMEHGIEEKEIYNLIIPRRTLQHRRARKERLTVEESDRLVRVVRIMTLAEKVFANREASMRWLRAPKKRFSGRTAMEMLSTEAGSRLVEEMLYQIDEGMAA